MLYATSFVEDPANIYMDPPTYVDSSRFVNDFVNLTAESRNFMLMQHTNFQPVFSDRTKRRSERAFSRALDKFSGFLPPA